MSMTERGTWQFDRSIRDVFAGLPPVPSTLDAYRANLRRERQRKKVAGAYFRAAGDYLAGLPQTDLLHKLAQGWQAVGIGKPIQLRYKEPEATDSKAITVAFHKYTTFNEDTEEFEAAGLIIVPEQFPLIARNMPEAALSSVASVLSEARDFINARGNFSEGEVVARKLAARAEVLCRVPLTDNVATRDSVKTLLAVFPFGLRSLPPGVDWDYEAWLFG